MTDKRTSLRSRDKLSGRMEGNGLRALSRGGGCNKLPTGNINSQEFDHSWQDLGMGSSAPPKAHQVPGTEEHPYSSGQGGRTSLNITKRFYFQEIDEWAMPAPLLTQTPLGSSAAFDGYGSWTRSNLFSLQEKPKQKLMSLWGFAQLFTTTEYSCDSEDLLCDLYHRSHSVLITALNNAILTFPLQKRKW